MKTHILIITSLLLLLGMMSNCNSGSIVAKATGIPYEIVVVMERPDWNSEAGKAVKEELTSSVLGLPRAEPSMRITYVTPNDFNGILTYVRNILLVNINPTAYTKVSMNYEDNRWVQGQVAVTINAPNREELLAFMLDNKRILVDFFTNVEMNRAVALFENEYNITVMNTVKEKFGIMLNVPTNMNFYKDTTDFFWTSNNASTGRMDVVVYSFPYTDPNTFTAEYLIHKRDSVLKANIPGSFPESYMATETHYLKPSYTPITVHGKYCGVLRGLWRMQGDMMGGPFVSHTRLDETSNRIIVAEAFVYAPETDKRNYMRRLEASLYTLRLPGEFEKPIVSTTVELAKNEK
ncbi:DUF4837 family protein [Parabacteroides sp. PF5-9]|uniref:DUF4837 family protein n=1 Tax=Parabacteroides sp. PF5-9 TaxID=1742404 RepID=UPI002474AD22|nr:DUF4837 family protein [Parabacteroides sp. PF5-9]MDH6357988.1 hypothetical protein [Parabacteroides sp. PF5-9]